jgi:hypothetical protein
MKEFEEAKVADAVWWKEFDAAIARHTRVEFTWVRAHSGILLNECADQLVTMGVQGATYCPLRLIETPPDEIESQEGFVMDYKDIAQWEDWDDLDHLPRNSFRAESAGLAVDEELDHQAELFRRFAQAVLGENAKGDWWFFPPAITG